MSNDTRVQPTSRSEPQQRGEPRQADTRAMLPRVDVFEDDTGITLLADLPGVPGITWPSISSASPSTFSSRCSFGTPDRLEPVYAEVRVPRYRRVFTLSRELDPGRIEANLKDGVLNLRIPKQEHAQPRRIQVQVG